MSLSHQPQQPITPSSATSGANSDIQSPRIVSLYQSPAYLHFLEWPADHSAECVHSAQFHHHEAGPVTAFAKLYKSENGSNRGLLNEITAYVLGKILGVPLADYAFVCFVPLNKLPSKMPGWVKALLKGNKEITYPAFCTTKIPGANASIYFNQSGKKLFSEDLRQWKSLPLAARYDQHISNTDRHRGNFMRVGRHEYRLFDHGRLVTEDGNWKSSDLDEHGRMLRDSLLNCAWPDVCPKEIISEMLMHMGYHETAVTIALPELRWWWDKLAPLEDANSFERYLLSRAKELSAMYLKAYNLVV